MPDTDQATEQLLAKLGTEALHQLGPDVLRSMAKMLNDFADHIKSASETHPEAQPPKP